MTTIARNGSVRWDITGKPSEAVIMALSEASNVDPLNFDQCLYDVVDPDALDALARWPDVNVEISFSFESYTVTVDGAHVHVETATDE